MTKYSNALRRRMEPDGLYNSRITSTSTSVKAHPATSGILRSRFSAMADPMTYSSSSAISSALSFNVPAGRFGLTSAISVAMMAASPKR